MPALGTTIARALAAGLLLAGLGASCALTGCAHSRDPLVLDMPPTVGAMAVDIENFRGSVEIRADDRVETISVGSSIEGPEDAHELVRIDAHIDEQGPRAVLRVRTATDFEDPDAQAVNLRITAPRVDGVRVINAGGEVAVVRATGAVEITNTGGAVEFRTDKPVIDPVTITTVDGNIYYQVPPESTGAFDLVTLDGVVSFKSRDSETGGSEGGRQTVVTTLNRGTNPIIARTNDGNIFVRVEEDAVNITRAFRVSVPDPRDYLYLQGKRRYTRNLPDDHPEVYEPTRQSARYLDEQ